MQEGSSSTTRANTSASSTGSITPSSSSSSESNRAANKTTQKNGRPTTRLRLKRSRKLPPHSRSKCLITGGCGFIGHHVVEHFAKNTNYQLIVVDKLSYASKGYDRLRDTGVFHDIETFTYDLTNPMPPGLFYEMDAQSIEVIIHIAAETHVDNSIDSPVPFIENNVSSTLNLLEFARKLPKLKHFIYFSTDEVFGSAAAGEAYKEGDAHRPSNPYSASKSAAEMICHSYSVSYTHLTLPTILLV